MANLTEHEAQQRSAAAEIQFDPAKNGQFAVVPEGYSVTSLECFQASPNRHRADHKFVDVSSLSQYLNRFATDDTMICADYGAAMISATIDGDAPETPSHREHRARFSAMYSDRVKAWLGICGKGMTQVAFGLFLEDRSIDVVQPDAASVMDMVMTFDATKKVAFKSSQRLHDGQRQFQYVEENETRGAVTLPDHFIVLAPIYRGMEPQKIKFMVRYRIEDGALRFQVDMHDKDAVLREAFERCVDALRNEIEAELPIYVTG